MKAVAAPAEEVVAKRLADEVAYIREHRMEDTCRSYCLGMLEGAARRALFEPNSANLQHLAETLEVVERLPKAVGA